MKLFFHKNEGFTFIEILVTASIIALLSTIGATGYQAIARGGRDALRKSDLEQIRSALEIYKSENNQYPTDTISSCYPDDLSPDYINNYPTDPKDPNYSYCYVPSSSSPILSYELCAHLENGDSSTDDCGGTTACVENCNYMVVNP